MTDPDPEDVLQITGEFTDWIYCGECGSDNVIVTSPQYYESVFECEDCGAEMHMGW